jgi:ABC-type branched-subunit amino acid transport system substrate-binding protein
MTTTIRSTLTRRDLFAGALAAGAAVAVPRLAFASDATLYFGVAAPLSGDKAGYGEVWKKGMNLAVDELNAAGGIKGRKLALVFEDTQSDPKQAIPVAQSFVDDPRIIAELGDFSSPASEAASPIYERAQLVQFGFNNSDPKFTLGGSYMFSTTSTVVNDASKIADYIFRRLGKRAAVLYQNTQWGDAGQSGFAKGTVLTVLFFADDPRPEIQRFVNAYVKAYGEKPDVFAATSYDAVKIAAWAAERGGFDRAGFYRAFVSATALPSLIHGPFSFGSDRRPVKQQETWITIKGGQFVALR